MIKDSDLKSMARVITNLVTIHRDKTAIQLDHAILAELKLFIEIVAHDLEKRIDYCFHCGTKLKPWEPVVMNVSHGPVRQVTDHKWCTNCCGVACKTIATIMIGGV